MVINGRTRLFVGLCVLSVPVLIAQQVQPAAPEITNTDVMAMLKARLPETTIMSVIEADARRGAVRFDTSPQALVALGQAGATERVLNIILWTQNDLDPTMEVPRPRGAFYRAGANTIPLRGFMVMPPFLARFSVFQHHTRRIAIGAAVSPVQIADSSPTILVQGFGADAAWQLVSIGRAEDHREMTVRSRNGFGGDFFSDSVFDSRDLHPISFLPGTPDSLSVRPANGLAPGTYALCGQPEGTWLRLCYEFTITGGSAGSSAAAAAAF